MAPIVVGCPVCKRAEVVDCKCTQMFRFFGENKNRLGVSPPFYLDELVHYPLPMVS